ncbi:type III pantothenate kinase [Catellatospora sp. TT07R-123]|uniref:type III pantothenate kinase n=1 Tax=Catellatospora sp. TT07R-123 TaxID=2733863 RepID=UPI001AFE3FB7|nr:type III pantothenate kinase [Catellatospora sp. TT07R-123]GHJ42885.1 type III pantothenate kinase [Catellatospora sp. TT07R-123]
MLLTVDIGNTNTVLALFDGDRVHHTWRIGTDRRTTADELHLKLAGLLGPRLADISGVAACSTVPDVKRELRTMLARYHGDLPALVIESGVTGGLALRVDHPHEVGADRVANALAAHRLYGGAAIVVDFGTSTNFDVVGDDGAFLGGVLAPGIQISMDALATYAAQLRKVEARRPATVIGKNTMHCLQSGLVYGFAGQVDGIVSRILDELGGSVQAVVATGGLAPLVTAECKTVTHHEPHLTLIGLQTAFAHSALVGQ